MIQGRQTGGRQRQFRRRTNLGAEPVWLSHLEDLRMPPGATLSIHELEAHMAKLIDPATGQFPIAGDSNIYLDCGRSQDAPTNRQ